MTYTQLKLKPEYREKLFSLAQKNNRSMASMVEVLIDEAVIPTEQVQRKGSLFNRDGKIVHPC